ncbi:MAG: ABC transporter ATP-binding protein [Chloroflexota bacterium]
MNAIELQGISHVYCNGRGVHGLDLTVREGEIFGFLGPNGAGKTTLIRTLLGFLSPTGGSGRVLGLDIVGDSRELRAKVGYLPSEPALYDFLSGLDNIEFALAVRGVTDRARVRELAERLEINLKQRYKTLSRGNKQKVAIIAALAHDPRLLILDEPTTGLDPLVQDTVRAIIREEQARGVTVFMSSHDMAEVEALSDRVGIIRDGRLVAVDEVGNLRQRRMKYIAFQASGELPDLAALAGVSDLRRDGRRIRFTFTGDLSAVLEPLLRAGLTDLTVTDPPLEEVFLSFYGQNGHGQGVSRG